MTVALVGTPPPEWPSLQRTHRAYQKALSSAGYRVLTLSEQDPIDAGVGAVINFWGSAVWSQRLPARIPKLVCLHGGAIINHRQLEALVGEGSPADTIIANCTSDIAILERVQPCLPRLEVLRLPVSPSVERLSKMEVRMQLGLPGDALLLGFVARLYPGQGFAPFPAQSAAYCRERHGPRVHGIVVGAFQPEYALLGELSHNYRAYIAGLVAARKLEAGLTFLELEHGDNQLGALYSALDLLIHPTTSPDENFGYVPLEAWKCGTPTRQRPTEA